MLDSDTKRRIDTARDILVGKVPDPKSQVEQITIALIYKFMDDMDAESEELGGKRKFFTGEFARYGWAKLMDRSLGGHEMLGLYGEGIAKMPENPGIPLLFRANLSTPSTSSTPVHSNLSPDERGRLANSFTGYDISPDMVRLSLVNLYLHGFAAPNIVYPPSTPRHPASHCGRDRSRASPGRRQPRTDHPFREEDPIHARPHLVSTGRQKPFRMASRMRPGEPPGARMPYTTTFVSNTAAITARAGAGVWGLRARWDRRF